MKEFIGIWLVLFAVFMSGLVAVCLGLYINQHFANDIWTAIYILTVFTAFAALMCWAENR